MNLMAKALLASLLTVPIASYAEPPSVTLYLLGYQIPDERRMSVVEQDIQAFNIYQQNRVKATYFNPMNQSAPQSKRDAFESLDPYTLTLCDFSDFSYCLSQIKNNTESYRQSIETLEPVFHDIDKLRQANSSELKSVFPSNLQLMSSPLPSYQLITKTLLTKNALIFHDDPKQALIQICADVAFGKSLIRSQQNLIQSMVGTMIVHSQLDLLAQSSQPLPSSCQQALTPMKRAGTSMCPLVKSESRQMTNEIMATPRTPILFSRRASIKQLEKWAQPYCADERLVSIYRDKRMPAILIEAYKPLFFNKIGALLLNVAMPDYSAYQYRLQDANAHLRLWQAALSAQCNTDSAHYVESVAKGWQPTRQLRLDSQRLTIDTYDKSTYPQLSLQCRIFAKN